MRVAVIGGGYAGMAAAVTLAERGVPATVFEAADTLGGRARRVERHGLKLDNGQHLLIGAYRETLRLIRAVNPNYNTALLRAPLHWEVHRRFRLKAARLPFSLGLLGGVLSAQGVGLAEKLGALRFMLRQRHCHFFLGRDMSVAQFLDAEAETGSMRRFLWGPLCLAALNTPPDRACAQVFLNVLRDGLNGGSGASDLLWTRCDLSALFPDPAAAYVGARGGKVLTGTPVQAVEKTAAGFAVVTADAAFEFDRIICALPPHRLAPLAQLPELAPLLAAVSRLGYRPITTVYLQYPAAVRLPIPMLGVDAEHAPWFLDRGQLCGQPGLIAAALSAVAPSAAQSGEALAQAMHQVLRGMVPDLPAPLWQQVIAEKRATFSCETGMQRPPQQTALDGFYLAGDYVAGDYPATIEGAVRSGIAGAKLVL